MDLQTLKTPALVLDVERVKRNAESVSARVRGLGASLRPHVKTHKCVEVARIQTAGHDGRIAVSTLGEARAFVANGFKDLLYTMPIEPGKIDEALGLARECGRLALQTSDADIPPLLEDAARRAGVLLDVFLEVDCGYGRCGVRPEADEAREIPRRLAASSHLRFGGLLTHAGHSYHARSPEDLLAIARRERDVLLELAGELKRDGVAVPSLSIGSTPTVRAIDSLNGIDEVRPGNYIFFDVFQATLGTCRFDECAITVLAAVVDRDRTRRQVAIDAGAIALSKDRGPVEFDAGCGYGRVQDLEGRDLGLTVRSVSQEHGVVPVGNGALDSLKVGTRVRILVNHSCLAVAQHREYQVLEGGRIVDRWRVHRGW